ncbi:hypothetical protein RHSIM_Rhsim03G0248600 [Rhododendron simsii]|uniref:Gnk2-homologous domain-containing protein n=1 Tax=Rhododendron simsii TaxID=118357 RepID=A0A834H5X5_RHOSS|nr:hypothetical protein RHSIM_Rhsim03G0248600 [Rhododendron simsii]
MWRYSNKSMEGVMEEKPSYPVWNVKQNVTSVEQFKDVLENLLESLKDKAAAGGSHIKFASGNVTGPDTQTVYALVQCTPDICRKDCSDCIQGAIDDDIPNFASSCVGPAGGRILDRVVIFDLSLYLSLVKYQLVSRFEGQGCEPGRSFVEVHWVDFATESTDLKVMIRYTTQRQR